MHILLHGESGSGKSWLYKQVFAESNVPYIVANLANASRFGTITAELKNLVDREERPVKVGYDASKSAEASAYFLKADVKHAEKYELGQKEPFEACLAMLSESADGSPSVLVFDNLEAVFANEGLLRELADLIILCDDDRYAKYKVKIMIVGVPAGVKEYFYKTPHHATVANRLVELPEVSRLTKHECLTLVKRGLIEKLSFQVEDEDALFRHVEWVTDRLPQLIHEYCLQAAYIGEPTRSLTDAQLSEADTRWLASSLHHVYTIIESHMNFLDTKAGRRNQTMYALAFCQGDQFKAGEVEAIVREQFPTSTKDTTLNVAQVLAQLATGERALVKRSPRGDAFTFSDARSRMVLRTMLRKTSDERVEKLPLTGV